jgi:hypothetical protein
MKLFGHIFKDKYQVERDGIFTYPWVCVDLNLSKGVLDRMILKHGNFIGLRSHIELLNTQEILKT